MRVRMLFRTVILAAVLAVSACENEDAVLNTDDAYTEIAAAINLKANECGNQPAYPLIIPISPPEYGVRLCGLLIIGAQCPFNDYPVFCIEMYTRTCDFCDVPILNP